MDDNARGLVIQDQPHDKCVAGSRPHTDQSKSPGIAQHKVIRVCWGT